MITFKHLTMYLLYTILFIIFILIVLKIEQVLQMKANKELRLMPLLLYRQIVYVLVGIMIGIPSLLREWKRSGSWKVDIGKLLIIGVPTCLLAYYPNIYFLSDVEFFLNTFLSHLLLTVGSAQIVFHLLFGLILVTSFYKEENKYLL